MVLINRKATGQRIKAVIKNRGYSIRQVTMALGLSDQAIYKWCWGSRLPSVGALAALADLLHVTMEDLLVIERR